MVLVLITVEYPYGKGETFIEYEIFPIAKGFSKVYIFALNAKKGMVATRPVPDNVVVVPVGCVSSKYRYIKYSLNGLKQDIDLPVGNFSLKGIACLYAKGRSRYVTSVICDYFEHETLDFDKAVVYSYWFTDQAIAAWKVKNYFRSRGISAVAVSRAHGYDLYWERNLLKFLPYQDISLKNLDMAFPCSENGSNYLKNKYPALSHKISTSFLGTVDYGILATPKNSGQYTIVTCSNIIPLKRVQLLAEALHIVEKSIQKSIKWVCIGDGPLLDDLKRYCDANLKNIMVDFKGRLKNSEVIQFYKKNYVDLFVNVSESEGLPVSIMEAQSFGIPTLATDVGGTSEIVIDGLTGKLIPADVDAEILADAVVEIMENNCDRRAVRNFWEEHFDAKKNYEEWCGTLKKLVEKKG